MKRLPNTEPPLWMIFAVMAVTGFVGGMGLAAGSLWVFP